MNEAPGAATVCVNCGTSIGPEAKFCTHCGIMVARFCQFCGSDLQGSTGYCPSCGAPVQQRSASRPTRSIGSPPLHSATPAATPFTRQIAGATASFGLPLASWGQRVAASVLDGLILLVPSLFALPFVLIPGLLLSTLTNCHGTGKVLHCAPQNGFTGWIVAFDILITLLVWTVYYGVFNGLVDGQTPGNSITGTAVRDESTGELIGLWRGASRWLLRLALYALAIVPGLLNDLWPLWDQHQQSLADKVCNTVVIRTR